MIQLCPHCKEQWCEASKDGVLGRALRGVVDSAENHAEVGKFVGGLFGKTGENAGEAISTFASGMNPFTWVKGGVEALFGDKYKFYCPNCGGEWSTDNEYDDQTEEYEEWCKQQDCINEAIELIDSTVSMANSSRQEQVNHIKALESKLALDFIDNSANVNIKRCLYNALAYSQYVFLDDGDSASKTIKKSIGMMELPDADLVPLAIAGMLYDAEKPLGKYDIMKNLVFYKDIDEEHTYTFFTKEQFRERFDELTHSYVTNFLDIPSRDRRFLVIDDDLRSLSDSFVVLPLDKIPHGIGFPSGHPRSQELYVIHPYKPNEYIPYNDYQLSMFRDEIHEFSWIMECLGAKSISFHEDHMNEQKVEKRINKESGGGASFKGYAANGAYKRGETSEDYEKLTEELMEAKRFNITPDVLPYIPHDVVWYQHRPEWHRNCESRKVGRLSQASFKLSTNKITATNEQERKKIEADLKILLFKANGNHEQEEDVSLRSEESHTWTVDVEFYPLTEYNSKSNKNNKEVLQFSQQTSHNPEKAKPNYLIIGMLAIIIVLMGIILTIVL